MLGTIIEAATSVFRDHPPGAREPLRHAPKARGREATEPAPENARPGQKQGKPGRLAQATLHRMPGGVIAMLSKQLPPHSTDRPTTLMDQFPSLPRRSAAYGRRHFFTLRQQADVTPWWILRVSAGRDSSPAYAIWPYSPTELGALAERARAPAFRRRCSRSSSAVGRCPVPCGFARRHAGDHGPSRGPTPFDTGAQEIKLLAG